jgi:SAM-dependent methyltransferase
MKLDIGCGTAKRPGYMGMDVIDHPAVDIRHDLRRFPWPLPDDSVDELLMLQVIEHLPDTVRTFEEIHRILKPDGVAVVEYPWYRSYGAFGDPTHVHFFNDRLIDYFIEDGLGAKYRYTDRFFRLRRRVLVTYPFLAWLPGRVLKGVSRHLGLDVVHAVSITIQPKK